MTAPILGSGLSTFSERDAELSGGVSTKDRLLSIINDIELLTDHFVETTLGGSDKVVLPGTPAASEALLTYTLLEKERELKETLKTGERQVELQHQIEESQWKLAKRDDDIKQLQLYLKQAELILSRAVYQARQKLEKIKTASENKISAEELIKFAHRISASNAVSAPFSWGPGDPRRPYPSDVEMRQGLLYNAHDYGPAAVAAAAAAAAASVSSPSVAGPSHGPGPGLVGMPAGPAGQEATSVRGPGLMGTNTGGWRPPPEQGMGPTRGSSSSSTPSYPPQPVMSLAGGAGPAGVMGDGGSKQQDDEVMSTDSSTSSSSDSQ